jgi:hypothetical protein
MIPDEPDYEQAKDALHRTNMPEVGELWLFTERVCVAYIRRVVSSEEENGHVYITEKIGTGGAGVPDFFRCHYSAATWRRLAAAGKLRRITRSEAAHFVSEDGINRMSIA